jgi:hypothetical protein
VDVAVVGAELVVLLMATVKHLMATVKHNRIQGCSGIE